MFIALLCFVPFVSLSSCVPFCLSYDNLVEIYALIFLMLLVIIVELF